MGVLWTFREPSLCRHVRRELMRNALRDFTPIIPTTACHQRNYVETYSRFIGEILFEGHGGSYSMGMENVLIPKENRSYLVTTQQGQKADRNALSCGQGRGMVRITGLEKTKTPDACRAEALPGCTCSIYTRIAPWSIPSPIPPASSRRWKPPSRPSGSRPIYG